MSEPAALAGAAGPDMVALWSGLLGGLALFLLGMDFLTRGLKAAAGSRMKTVLARLTRNRFVAVLTGAGVTAAVNSSSVTTVVVIGFVSAGLMTPAQSVGVIMGANIGSTITAQVLAFKITAFALPLLAAGFAVWFVARKGALHQSGAVALGMGLVFFGMAVMSDAMAPLRSHPPFLDLVARVDGRLAAILIGAAFTAVIQSSAATTGIVLVMVAEGLVGLETAIAITFGANIGTCATALLASIGKPRAAVRVAVIHVLFNGFGVVVWVAFVPELAGLVSWISPGDGPRQVANAHTLFNVANTVLLIGFTGRIARLAERLVPRRPEIEEGIRPRYLDPQLLATPPLALEMARREIGRLGLRVAGMVRDICPAILTGSREDLEAVRARDADVDALHGHVVAFLGRLGGSELSDGETRRLMRLLDVANQFEQVGDLVETGLVTLGERRIDEDVRVSAATRDVIGGFHRHVVDAVDGAVRAVVEDDPDAARHVRAMKADLTQMARDVTAHQAGRLRADAPNRLRTYAREIEAIEHLHQVYRIARRIAKAVAEGGLGPDTGARKAAQPAETDR